jgi:hypothetical protein
MTTRPHTTLPPRCKKPDLELDTVGFSSDEVNKYLQEVVSGPRNLAAIQSFLGKNRIMASLVHIPIQLDVLCYVWESLSSEVVPQTMTAAYLEITRQLWLKDVERLSKVPGSKLVNISAI